MFKKSLVLSVFLSLVFVANAASAAYTAKSGDLLRTADDATVVLVMDNGTRLPVTAEGYAIRYNNNFGLVKTVTAAERGSYTSDLVLGATNSLASGTVFMYELDEPGIYVIDNGFKRLFSTWTGFEGSGHTFNQIQWAGQYTMYPTGVPVQ